MRLRALSSPGCVLLAFAAVSGGAPLMAQEATVDYALAGPVTLDEPENLLPPLSAEEMAALAQALTYDPVTLSDFESSKTLRLPGRHDRSMFDMNGTSKPDGPGTVVLKPALPLDWDAKVGADLGLPVETAYGERPMQPLPVNRAGSGAAWASVGVPNLATVDARVDPGNEQGRLATTFKQTIPVGSRMSVILQNGYAVTETYGQPSTQPTDLPLMAMPQTATGAVASQVWSTEQVLKFNVLSTGTTLSAGLHSISTDPVTHNTFSAEQRLFGPLNVTTAVTDWGQTSVNKRVTAGFKLAW